VKNQSFCSYRIKLRHRKVITVCISISLIYTICSLQMHKIWIVLELTQVWFCSLQHRWLSEFFSGYAFSSNFFLTRGLQLNPRTLRETLAELLLPIHDITHIKELDKQNQSSELTEARMVRELGNPPVHWLPLFFGDDYQDVQPAEVVLGPLDNY
jgi:predicted membrane protein